MIQLKYSMLVEFWIGLLMSFSDTSLIKIVYVAPDPAIVGKSTLPPLEQEGIHARPGYQRFPQASFCLRAVSGPTELTQGLCTQSALLKSQAWGGFCQLL